jgi:hypothetical protein
LEVLSGKCPEFFTSGICLVLFIQNLSRILSCPEYVQLNCPEFFHVRNMSGFIYPEFVQNYFMSRICPVFSAHKKFRTVNLTILPDIFQIFSEPHGQIPDIFDDIFRIFLFRRARSPNLQLKLAVSKIFHPSGNNISLSLEFF